MTAIEGNKMARAGRGAQALATAAIGSFVAGTIATVPLIFTAPAMASFAVSLKAQDYFAITLISFIAVSTVLGSSPVAGLAARHGARLPVRRPAGGWRGGAHLPVLLAGEEADPAPRGVRSRRHRGR